MAFQDDDQSSKGDRGRLVGWTPQTPEEEEQKPSRYWGHPPESGNRPGPSRADSWQDPWSYDSDHGSESAARPLDEATDDEFLSLDDFLIDLKAEERESEYRPLPPESAESGPYPAIEPRIHRESAATLPESASARRHFRPITPSTGEDAQRVTEIEKLAEAILFVRNQLKDLAKVVHDLQRDSVLPTGVAREIPQLKARLDRLQSDLHGLAGTGAERPATAPQPQGETGGESVPRPAATPSVETGPKAADRPAAGTVEQASLSSMPTGAETAPTQEENLAETVAARAQELRDTRQIDRLLRLLVQRGASDLHLTVGYAPMFRLAGEIEPLRYKRTRSDDWHRMIEPITTKKVWEQFTRTGDVDFAYEIKETGRFRVNLFRQHRGEGAVFRVIPDKILTIEQLGMPKQLHRIARIPGGLVLVTGPTGSGKSTTLAALIHEINATQPYHIITLEDPIEFVHHNRRSIIHQREIGTHTQNFATGLQDAVREDPNLLLVGEMRDLETIRLALESASKGLLVFATLHTNNAAKTVERIVNVFPTDEQDTIRSVLADTIRAILAQQLVKRKDGGLVAAVEILFGSPALSNLIRDGKTHQITNLIQTGRKEGMTTMDEALLQLVNKGIITSEAAFEKAIEKSLFRDPEQAKLEEEIMSSVVSQPGGTGAGQ
ncbi:MAG: PilT/PilU family type 4a pilus ATPase [Bradymonadales bacterium]|nr:PilT/PilU family type 4a pilus ATPase [Bradymonadales bacterium]